VVTKIPGGIHCHQIVVYRQGHQLQAPINRKYIPHSFEQEFVQSVENNGHGTFFNSCLNIDSKNQTIVAY